jgi:hypothetical protein
MYPLDRRSVAPERQSVCWEDNGIVENANELLTNEVFDAAHGSVGTRLAVQFTKFDSLSL